MRVNAKKKKRKEKKDRKRFRGFHEEFTLPRIERSTFVQFLSYLHFPAYSFTTFRYLSYRHATEQANLHVVARKTQAQGSYANDGRNPEGWKVTSVDAARKTYR